MKTFQHVLHNEINQLKVLNVIAANSKTTRTDIAKITKFNRNSVSIIVNRLIENMYIKPLSKEKPTSGMGRHSQLLCINPNGGYFVGVSVGSQHVHIIIINMVKTVIYRERIKTPDLSSDVKSLNSIFDFIAGCLNKSNIPENLIRSIVFKLSARVDEEKGVCLLASNIGKGWINLPIVELANRRFKTNVYLATPSLHLSWPGTLGTDETGLFCHWGSGIGISVVCGGELLNRKLHLSFGHLVLDNKGPLCGCGQRGCVEAYAGGRNLAMRAVEAIQQGQDSLIKYLVTGDLSKITTSIVLIAARNNDELALKLVDEAVNSFATALSYLVQMVVPKIVVFSGGIIQEARDVLVDPMIRKLNEKCPKPVNIEINTLDGYEYSLCASMFGFNKVFSGRVLERLSDTDRIMNNICSPAVVS
ncbi:MAG: hypothetical protein A2Y10_17435 [Planctomycetes bacterium GWF2_41_51]|nr:MAG: hypothetical protein A2Y10_17435 [Planctomycetes bacterium GWF2_41_51]HBG28010.1 hypothetical protein [Phycisphaerales bacterium]